MPDLGGPPPAPDPEIGHGMGTEGRLGLMLRAFANAPLDADTPQLLISQAVAATGSSGGVVCGERADRLVILASDGYTPAQRSACGVLMLGDLTLPLTYAATTGQPVWLVSQADTVRRFPRIVRLVPRAERAYAALPLRANGISLGVLGISFAERHDFTDTDRGFLLALADICAIYLQQWSKLGGPAGEAGPTAQIGHLIKALSVAESADEVARVIAEAGAISAGAEFANIAIANAGAGRSPTANLYHASGLDTDVARRYEVIPLDDATPLGTVLKPGSADDEIWLESLAGIEARYPSLLQDTVAAGLASTASLALHGRNGGVIGAMGVAWRQAQTFSDAQQDEVRVVARLAADALGRALLLEAERTARRGDWYDAMLLEDGRLLLIVGDVAGHGLEAAVTMGQMRSAARALVPAHGPAALLDALDRFAVSTLKVSFVTAAAVIIDPARRTLSYCLAGHPSPLLGRPDGTVISLDEARGAVLGFGVGDRPERMVTFAPGSFLVLFTDGLVERRGEVIDVGLARIGAALKTAVRADQGGPPEPADLCDALVAQSLPHSGRDDDTAILCAFLS